MGLLDEMLVDYNQLELPNSRFTQIFNKFLKSDQKSRILHRNNTWQPEIKTSATFNQLPSLNSFKFANWSYYAPIKKTDNSIVPNNTTSNTSIITGNNITNDDMNDIYNIISKFETGKTFGNTLSAKDLQGIDLKDAKGHKTFGYGLLYHPDTKQYMDEIKTSWTQSELEELYKKTVDNKVNVVKNWAKENNLTLNNNQIKALTSAIFNFGDKFLNWSVAQRIVKNPNDKKIYTAWAKFSDHQANKYPGLVKRRRKEADIYFGNA